MNEKKSQKVPEFDSPEKAINWIHSNKDKIIESLNTVSEQLNEFPEEKENAVEWVMSNRPKGYASHHPMTYVRGFMKAYNIMFMGAVLNGDELINEIIEESPAVIQS